MSNQPKTRWTKAEAAEAAFRQFPIELNRYEIGRACTNDNDSYLGSLLLDLLSGTKEAFNREATKVDKVTRTFVRDQFLQNMKAQWTDATVKRWCSANQIQRYEIDSAIWFEQWGKAQEAA